jgi:hypothetical protein
MSGGKRTAAVVSRDYKTAPDYCARALELLLNKPVSKEIAAGVTSTNGDDAKGSENVSRHIHSTI